jgi:hypothetical protein
MYSSNYFEGVTTHISVPTTLENLCMLEHVHSQVYPGDIFVPTVVQKQTAEGRTYNPRKKHKLRTIAERDDNTVSLGSVTWIPKFPKNETMTQKSPLTGTWAMSQILALITGQSIWLLCKLVLMTHTRVIQTDPCIMLIL